MTKKINAQPSTPEPTKALQDAIEKLTLFTSPEAAHLELSEDGSLVPSQKLNPIDRMIGLAHCYITPLFSDKAKLEQEKKLHQIKQEILQARDTLKSHASLIEKLKQGDETEKKLAHSALEMIGHYNAVISQDQSSLASKYDFYNYERNRLLLDSEIKDQAIELPQTFSLKFDSHSTLPAQKTINELSSALKIGPDKGSIFNLKTAVVLSQEAQDFDCGSKDCASWPTPTAVFRFNSIHKKTDQFMIDTFRMKTIRMLQNHPVQLGSMSEVVGLVKNTPIEIDVENANFITMRQMLEYCPGFNILLTGSFKRTGQDHKFMSMPVLEDLRLTSEISHSGFPYPAQHTGGALSEKLIDALPLRMEQIPLFQLFLQRKTKLAQSLLHEPDYIARSRQHLKMTREIFNRQHQTFLTWQRDLHHFLVQNSDQQKVQWLDDFFNEVSSSPSPFDILAHAQDKMNHLFIKEPFDKLEEQWLTAGSILRSGNESQKLQCTQQILQDAREEASKSMSAEHPIENYIKRMGKIVGEASQAIILQYFSEKIGFPPPMLSDFERKVQTCAFQQAQMLIAEYDNPPELNESTWEENLKSKCKMDIAIFKATSVDDLDLTSALLTNSLEIYFNSRYYAK
jgi:hypothetical protein